VPSKRPDPQNQQGKKADAQAGGGAGDPQLGGALPHVVPVEAEQAHQPADSGPADFPPARRQRGGSQVRRAQPARGQLQTSHEREAQRERLPAWPLILISKNKLN